jgi:hypothetical protein
MRQRTKFGGSGDLEGRNSCNPGVQYDHKKNEGSKITTLTREENKEERGRTRV